MSAGEVLETACIRAATALLQCLPDDGMFWKGKQMHQLGFIIIAKVLLYSKRVKIMIELLVKTVSNGENLRKH